MSAKLQIPERVQLERATPTEADPVLLRVERRDVRQRMRFDMHYALEAGIVLSGLMGRQWGAYRRRLAPGDVWFCGAWEPHGWSTLQAPCERVVCFIFPPLVGSHRFPEAPLFSALALFTVPPADRPRTPAWRRATMLALASRLLPLRDAHGEMARLWRRHLLEELLLLAAESWRPVLRETAGIAAMHHQIAPAVELVFGEQRLVTISEAAKACDLGRTAFVEAFKELMGLNFGEFALRHRVSEAMTDVLQTGAPLKAVARRWGFVDASHLHRCVRRYYEVSPGEYRRQYAGE